MGERISSPALEGERLGILLLETSAKFIGSILIDFRGRAAFSGECSTDKTYFCVRTHRTEKAKAGVSGIQYIRPFLHKAKA